VIDPHVQPSVRTEEPGPDSVAPEESPPRARIGASDAAAARATPPDAPVDEPQPREFADERSLGVLDFDAVRQMVARQCLTDAAAAGARELLPAFDLAGVRAAQRATTEMRAIVRDAPFALARVADVSPAIARAARGAALGPQELRETGIALSAADAVVRRVRGSAGLAPSLVQRALPARPLPEILAAIDRAIGERGEVLDRASPALARIRRGIVTAGDEARDRVQAILRAPAYAKAIQDAIVTVRDGRFVIPVKSEFSGLVQGVVHDTSSTGHTLFVEPLVALEANNRVRTLRLDEEREVRRILLELSQRLGAVAEQASVNLEILAEFDLALARVRVAEAMRATPPAIVDAPHVRIRLGRHPLLGDRAVPQSFELDDDVRFIVISGPNMGGKTVALKMLGLFVTMAYCGMHLPAGDGTVVGGFDHLGCDIGDEQSIAENASTFSAHLRRLRTLVEGAGPRSLVLVDEIASGTEPGASAALATATLEFLLARGARGVVTTHATELKLYANDASGLQNASVRFDAETYVPTYELDLGSPGQSLAFPLARALGLPPAIVARAESLQSTSDRDYDRALEELSHVRTEAGAERDALRRERAQLVAERERAQRHAEALERERRALTDRADEKFARRLREFTAELERRSAENGGAVRRPGKITPGQSSLLDAVLADVRRDLGIRTERPRAPKEAATPGAPRLPRVGDRVFVESLGVEGTYAEDAGESAVVALGSMRSVVKRSELRLVRAAPAIRPGGAAVPRGREGDDDRSSGTAAGGGYGVAQLEAASRARTELDVRGRRFVEAEPIVDRFIDESKLAGMSPLRLIHGKGTGLLGRGLQDFLKTVPGVVNIRYGVDGEGGSGVTVFELA